MKRITALILTLLCVLLTSCYFPEEHASSLDINQIPAYSGKAYVKINGNIPGFTDSEKNNTVSFEKYSRLDYLGRCQTATANVSKDTMPREKRGDISSVKPTGWVQRSYAFVEDGHIYNRCHLIAYMLTGENANDRNLITGTRYMNTKGMLPFETKVCDYVRSTGNHVLYRVTPVFKGENLLANGVEMEAWSVEDSGRGICFNIYCYNVQPGVSITYSNGRNKADGSVKVSGKSSIKGSKSSTGKTASDKNKTYILNTNTMKFHLKSCSGAEDINPENRKSFRGNRKELLKRGYSACKTCKP